MMSFVSPLLRGGQIGVATLDEGPPSHENRLKSALGLRSTNATRNKSKTQVSCKMLDVATRWPNVIKKMLCATLRQFCASNFFPCFQSSSDPFSVTRRLGESREEGHVYFVILRCGYFATLKFCDFVKFCITNQTSTSRFRITHNLFP